MSSNAEPAQARTLRIGPETVKARLEAGEPIVFLDARSQKAWDASPVKVCGAVRIRPLLLAVDPAWGRAGLVVIYCA
jgi:hypothetical protein